jgi:outer membrane biosynthesis protein TonB
VQQQVAPARYDREAQRNRWLIPQLAAAAALLLGLVAGGWWTWQQRHLATEATEVAANITPNLPAATTLAPANAPVAPTLPPVVKAPATVVAPATKPLATTAPARRQRPTTASAAPFRTPAPQATTAADTTAPRAVAAEVASTTNAPLASAPTPTPPAADSLRLAGRLVGVAMQKRVETYAAPLARMPAAPKVPPAPLGGYAALREKLRREATEFKPEEGERSLSGTVQLRLTIGADGKIQQTKVLRGLRDDYDAEAQRLVCDGPGWVPGISGGKRAPLEIDIAVPF